MSASEATQITLEIAGAIAQITINRPEKKNALTQAMYLALSSAIEQAESDASVRVILLTGCENSFTSGNDVADFLHNPPSDDSRPAFQFLTTIAAAEKPIVAAVNGVAVGIGTTMLLHCDLAYAARSALFQLPFVNLGLCPEAASSLLLPVRVGYQRAAQLFLLGESFSAEQALSYGLVLDIYEDDELLPRVRALAERLAAQPPASVRLTKKLMKQFSAEAVMATMAQEGRYFLERLQSPEAKEAFTAFLERRKPDFSSDR